MSFIGSIEDRLAIREFYDAFAYVSSVGDKEEWLSMWADGCRWKTYLFNLTGKDELSEQWDALWANFDKASLLCNVGSIEVAGDQAEVKMVVREQIKLKSGGIMKQAGIYQDKLVKEQGRWLLSCRVYEKILEEVPKNFASSTEGSN